MKNIFQCIALIIAFFVWEILILAGNIVGKDQR